mmetsp:Transcript_14095/g.55508  ORF Transcript_14095/g.55508 Transcript_14095/m.55508 type:complete len:528 (+) Transcript_14095:110-1693(+)
MGTPADQGEDDRPGGAIAEVEVEQGRETEGEEGQEAAVCRLDKRHAAGVVVLLATVAIWVLSGELIQYIYDGVDFDQPFFLTYYSTALFSVYLTGFLFVPSWKCSSRQERSFAEAVADLISGRRARDHHNTEGDSASPSLRQNSAPVVTGGPSEPELYHTPPWVEEEGEKERERALFTGAALSSVAEHLNRRTRNAKLAQMDSSSLFQVLFFKYLSSVTSSVSSSPPRSDTDRETKTERKTETEAETAKKSGFEAEAIVQEVHSGRVTVFLPKYGVKAPVFLSKKDGTSLVPPAFVPGTSCSGEFSVDESETVVTISTADGPVTLSVFDHLSVTVDVEEARAHLPTFKLALRSYRTSTAVATRTTAAMRTREVVRLTREAESERKEAEKKGLELSANTVKTYGQSAEEKTLYRVLNAFKEFRFSDEEATALLAEKKRLSEGLTESDSQTDGATETEDSADSPSESSLSVPELQQQIRKLRKKERQAAALLASNGPLDDAQKEKLAASAGLADAIDVLEAQLRRLQCS